MTCRVTKKTVCRCGPPIATYIHAYKYVTGFGKSCIVHTSDFAHLEINKKCKQWCKDLKFLEMIQE